MCASLTHALIVSVSLSLSLLFGYKAVTITELNQEVGEIQHELSHVRRELGDLRGNVEEALQGLGQKLADFRQEFVIGMALQRQEFLNQMAEFQRIVEQNRITAISC